MYILNGGHYFGCTAGRIYVTYICSENHVHIPDMPHIASEIQLLLGAAFSLHPPPNFILLFYRYLRLIVRRSQDGILELYSMSTMPLDIDSMLACLSALRDVFEDIYRRGSVKILIAVW